VVKKRLHFGAVAVGHMAYSAAPRSGHSLDRTDARTGGRGQLAVGAAHSERTVSAAHGPYLVTMRLPERDGEFEYRIRSPDEPHERIARELIIRRVFRLGGPPAVLLARKGHFGIFGCSRTPGASPTRNSIPSASSVF
jgi:hypothetical protein